MAINSSIFRNYDIRGESGTELTQEAAYKIARAYAKYTGAKKVVIGSDMRDSSPVLKKATIDGLVDSGVDVEDAGMISTDVIYYVLVQGNHDGGIMITASHMPKQFNGMKMLRLGRKCRKPKPIGKGLGMEQIEEFANNLEEPTAEKGSYQEIDVWDGYTEFVHSFANVTSIKKLKVVMDAGNGMGGVVAEKVFKGIDLDTTEMFFEPDGNFPNHDANPIIPKNRVDIIAKVKEVGADLGIAWDADCDRCYFIDENGDFVNGDFITALLAVHFLKRKKGAGIVYDIRSSDAVKDWIEKMDGVAYPERVGHTYIKAKMRETDSVFGGEISGHYYFADNGFMDNGFIPALILLEIISKEGKSLSEIISDLGEYHVSGEINYQVDDVPGIYAKFEERFADAELDKMDGLSVIYPDWKFNVRPSANDPVLRLNLEATTKEKLKEKLKLIAEMIGGKLADE